MSEYVPLLLLLAVSVFISKKSEQRRRIALLGGYLSRYDLEKHMATVTEGYLRALGEKEADRRAQVWRYLEPTEAQLGAQFAKFSQDFSQVPEPAARVSTLPVGLPYATMLFAQASFDVRKAFAVHARGLSQAVALPATESPRTKAFRMMAELMLMQHTCHWFCNSRAVATARLQARHQTSHEQVLAAVSSETRAAYRQLTGI